MSAPAASSAIGRASTIGHETSPKTVGQRFVVRAAPRREPPFDDELPARRLALVGPLDQQLPFDSVDLSVPASRQLTASADPFTAIPTPRHDLPDVAVFARRFVVGVIEIATGRRSATQLNGHTAPAVRAGLARDAGKITRLGTSQKPAALHSVHVGEPADGVAEVAAIVRVGGRFRALALRFEGLDGRWRCVRLQIG